MSRPIGFDLLLIADLDVADEHGLDLTRVVHGALSGVAEGRLAVQLRAKSAPGRVVLDFARRLRQVTRAAGAPLLVNDRVDVAVLVGADGVQLGRASVDVADARRLVRDAWVGVSTHEPAEVEEARRAGADYVLFGPVWATPGKAEPRGLEALEGACRADPLVFALGGVDPARAGLARRAGAHGVSFIRSVLLADDPARAVRALGRSLDSARELAPRLER